MDQSDLRPAEDRRPQAQAGTVSFYSDLARRTLLVAGIVLLLVSGALLIGYLADVFLVCFAAILLAILIRGSSQWLTRHTHLPAGWSLGVIVLLLAGLLVLVGWLSVTRLSGERDRLAGELSKVVRAVDDYVRQHLGTALLTKSAQAVPQTLSQGNLFTRVTGVASTTLNLLTYAVVIVILGLFLAAAPGRYVEGVLRLVPPAHRPRAHEVLSRLYDTLQWWLIGRIASMAEVGVLTGLALWLLGVPLAGILGLLTGLSNFVPTLGPIVAAIPPVLLGLTISPMTALYVLIAYTAVGMFDGYVATPLIQQSTVALPGGVIIVSQLLLGMLLGGLGVLLATPLAASIVVVVKELYVKDVLGDRNVG